MKVREVIKRLEADGWYRIRSKSGHRQFKHAVKKGRVTVAGQLNVDVPIKTGAIPFRGHAAVRSAAWLD